MIWFSTKKNEILLRRIIFHLVGIQSYYFLSSKLIVSIHLLMLISSMILHILSWKISFHTDKYCQVHMLIHENIFTEHIYRLEGTDRILLDSFFFWYFPFSMLLPCRLITSSWRLGGAPQLHIWIDLKNVNFLYICIRVQKNHCWTYG